MPPTALITGAASGIGYEFAKLFAKRSYKLVLVDLKENRLAQIKKEFEQGYGVEVVILSKDLSRTNAALEVYNEVRGLDLEIDVLINNAGFGLFGLFAETSWPRECEMIHLHILIVTHLTKLFLKRMIDRNKGQILIVSSLAAFQPGPLMSVYYATKAYLLSFTQALANEVKGSGVTVTALCPGITRSEFQKTVGNPDAQIRLTLISAKRVAEYGVRAMEKGKVIAIPGVLNNMLMFVQRLFPRRFVCNVVRRIQEKNRQKAGVQQGGILSGAKILEKQIKDDV